MTLPATWHAGHTREQSSCVSVEFDIDFGTACPLTGAVMGVMGEPGVFTASAIEICARGDFSVDSDLGVITLPGDAKALQR
jgi:hypothetical protein